MSARPRWQRCALVPLTGGELIRLQCYEGIDVVQAVYEWDISRQPPPPGREAAGEIAAGAQALEDDLYSERSRHQRRRGESESRRIAIGDRRSRPADDEFGGVLPRCF
ncbi:MAG: hypothetical protein R2705_00665 [Ilumatobacteraceae bacterium]